MLIVTGSTPRAETADRPLAYRLRERMLALLNAASAEDPDARAVSVVVCSDLWYLNADGLRGRPTISVGGPGVNALSAHLRGRIPVAFAVEDVLMVQVDLDFVDLSACCWGADHRATVLALDAFVQRYLDQFMQAALRSLSA